MIACRVRRRLALVAAWALLLPASAAAQLETETAPLAAPEPLEQTPPGISIDAAPAAAPTIAEDPDPKSEAVTTGDGGISVGPLGELTGGSAGTLDPGDGGLDPNLWRDTDASRLIDLFARLPVSARSPAMHDLARRMMLSTAGPPTLDVAAEDFVAARLEALIRLGEFEDATALVNVLPSSTLGARAQWHAAEALFWDDDTIGALCADARPDPRHTDAGVA